MNVFLADLMYGFHDLSSNNFNISPWLIVDCSWQGVNNRTCRDRVVWLMYGFIEQAGEGWSGPYIDPLCYCLFSPTLYCSGHVKPPSLKSRVPSSGETIVSIAASTKDTYFSLSKFILFKWEWLARYQNVQARFLAADNFSPKRQDMLLQTYNLEQTLRECEFWENKFSPK